MKRDDDKKQQEEYVKWCREQNLAPNNYNNLKRYLKEVKIWDSTQTRSEA